MTVEPPGRRRSHRVTVMVGALLLGCVAWRVGRAVTAVPRPPVNYGAKLVAHVTASQPPGEDAWPVLQAVLERLRVVMKAAEDAEAAKEVIRGGHCLKERADFYGRIDFWQVFCDPFDAGVLAPELHTLQQMRDAGIFDLLARIAAAPRAVRPAPEDRPLFRMPIPEWWPTRELAVARIACMRVAAREGDDAERVAAFEQTLALARIMGCQGTTSHRCLALMVTAMATQELRRELTEAPLDPVTGRALLAAMDRQLRLPPLSSVLEAERLRLLDNIQWSFNNNRSLDPERLMHLTSPRTNPLLREPMITMILAGRPETTDRINEFIDGAILNSQLTLVDRVSEGFDEAAFRRRLGFGHMFVELILPDLSSVIQDQDNTDVDVASTRVMLAIEIFRATNGRLPAALDDLVPDILDTLPVDPASGLPFVYRLTPGGPDDAPYALRLLGFDATGDERRRDGADGLPTPGVDALLSARRPVRGRR